jgi:hypothetical protein
VKSKKSQGLPRILHIGSVMDIEVLPMSGAGLAFPRNGVPNPAARTMTPQAGILARRAERLI